MILQLTAAALAVVVWTPADQALAKAPEPPKYVAKIDTSTAIGNFQQRNNANTLVVLIHGWNSDRSIFAQGKVDMTARSVFRTEVWDYDWSKDSKVFNPFSLVAPSSAHGQFIAFTALKGNYTHVQLVSHSAGAYANEIAARLIKAANPNVTVQQTFLDAFLPGGVENLMGLADTCIDNYYFREQLDVPIFGRLDYLLHTQVDIPRGANYDLTSMNPMPKGLLDIAADHGYPYRWYQGTVKGKLSEAAPKSAYDSYGYGFTKQVADGADGLPGFPMPWPSATFKADKGTTRMLNFNNQNNSITPGPAKQLPKPKPEKDFVNKLSAANVVESGGGGFVGITDAMPDGLQLNFRDPSASQSEFAYSEISFDTTALSTSDPINVLDFNYKFDDPLPDGTIPDSMFHVFLCNDDQTDWTELGAFNSSYAITPGSFESTTPIWLGNLSAGLHTLAFRFDSLDGDAGVQLRDFTFGSLTTEAVPEPSWLAATVLVLPVWRRLGGRRRRPVVA